MLVFGHVQVMTGVADCVNIHLDGKPYGCSWYGVGGRAALVFRSLCSRFVTRYRVWHVFKLVCLVPYLLMQFLGLAVPENNLDS